MELTPELRAKFLRFHEEYEFEHARLVATEVKGFRLAQGPWTAAQREVPLQPDELKLYKKLVALHSVNGGELFALAPIEAQSSPLDDHTA
jgi:hypothetical protein